MEIIPAIDLIKGKCVRLYQGDYAKETVFSEDPVSIAMRWKDAGATRLHLVDLDGAAEGRLCNGPVIEKIASQVQMPVQVGGGIRQIDTMEQLFNFGVQRVILGTAAIEDPDLVKDACRQFGDRVIVSIDVKDGYVRGRGWKEAGNLTLARVMGEMEAKGVKRFIYTDITRDGTLTEPNFAGIAEISSLTGAAIIAAGGISSIEHLKKLADLNVEGAIVGRAIYTGNIDLKEAIKVIR
ncbi:MAG: 1-(5-phosphoribosyl)-5-[(5-phosphoribosylamino)methylideneamino]imidazole-4-carboxamide isomerase [Dehalococcoidia bacterium]|nr:1-(5-phosphoribosyl)-5-[(5-phosphoribosylamino)methylideneamino]imidazole-4-carboxamide isomerase [Dehalococcoidia bacterium]